ncbi:cystinosin-like [Onthophagus taurus]|uniref:cystinosin-like n=1 Tax=Onthophagus taurus TaxID=166361 RepID=UPI000C2015FD|nr:cystinosin-like [Onthophagus taurus]
MCSSKSVIFCCSVFILLLVNLGECNLEFAEKNLNLLTDETKVIQLIIRNLTDTNIRFIVEHTGILEVTPYGDPNDTENDFKIQNVSIRALKAGETLLFTNESSSSNQAFIRVQVYKNQSVEVISLIMGWAYFLAWSISFYPQIWENYKRKSVIGLNFDFLVINLTGYVCYAAFNLGLYYIPEIRAQYAERYPFSIVSVLPNDIFFTIHALILTIYTCLQCFWYDKGDQTISWFGYAFHVVTGIITVVTMILCFVNYILWLDFLYIMSYIKLTVTICKYGPQAIMNYQRKSTDGWSIGMVLLDVAGGIFCTLQMFLNAYNYEKWEWILENPTKLWLGVLSLLFDFFFMAQHYCLYNKNHGLTRKRQQTIDLRMDPQNEKESLPV